MKDKSLCPVCGKYRFDSEDDICQICNWIHDGYQEENPDEDSLVNIMSLNEAKKAWTEGREVK